jgi:hypothetical protein
MKKIAITVIILALFASMILVAFPAKATSPDILEPLRIDTMTEPMKSVPLEDGPLVESPHYSYYNIGDQAIWLAYNYYSGGYFFTTFTLKGISAHAELWLKNTNAWYSPSDPRELPTITDLEIQYMLNEFENVIYPTDVSYFGAPNFRDGSAQADPYYPRQVEPTGRNVILVMNIRDQNWADSTYPYYVAGYFSPTVRYYTDRNVVTIDTWRWERRLGPEGTVWPPPAPPYPGGVDRPYVYDSTLTHEYQHLIHSDWNPSDPSFMNEGCSMYAEYLCNYGIDPSYLNSFFYTPDNSLTEWGDQGDINILADYGESALWAMYLSDHYGGSGTISYFVQAGVPGVDGVENALAHFGYTDSFEEVYQNFKLANLIRSDTPGGGKYNYHNIDLNDPSIDPIRIVDYEASSFPWKRASTSFGTTETILGYDTGMSLLPQFGSDYIQLSRVGKGKIYFDGDLTGIMPASTGGWTYDTTNSWWYAGDTDLLNTVIRDEVYVDPLGTLTLTLVTAWDLETYWDFGFVQISTDNGQTWTSLSDNEGYATTLHDPSAHPDAVANLPGLTDYNYNWAVGSYPAGPGAGDWDTLTFDLTAYSGMTVLIGFRCVTDWATVWTGWFIQSATVDSALALELIPLPAAPATFQVDWVLWDEAEATAVFPLDSLNNGSITPIPSGSVDFSVILVVTSTAEGAINSPSIVGLEDYQFMVQAGPEVGGSWAPQAVFTANDTPSVWLGLVPTLVLTTASVIIVRYRKKKHE